MIEKSGAAFTELHQKASRRMFCGSPSLIKPVPVNEEYAYEMRLLIRVAVLFYNEWLRLLLKARRNLSLYPC